MRYSLNKTNFGAGIANLQPGILIARGFGIIIKMKQAKWSRLAGKSHPHRTMNRLIINKWKKTLELSFVGVASCH